MTRCLTLLVAAYWLVAIETTLQLETGLVTPYGSFVWMLLPWLATLPTPSTSILAAALYGLLIDACSNHHPGLMIAVTLASSCVLQRVLTEKSLSTPLRLLMVSFVCGCLMSMFVATCSLLVGGSASAPGELVRLIVTSSGGAAVLVTSAALGIRSCRRTLIPSSEVVP